MQDRRMLKRTGSRQKLKQYAASINTKLSCVMCNPVVNLIVSRECPIWADRQHLIHRHVPSAVNVVYIHIKLLPSRDRSGRRVIKIVTS